MEHLGAYLAVVSVFAFLSVATVAGIVGEYKRRALRIEPLRAAIERGQPLDPQGIERLPAARRAWWRVLPRSVLRALGHSTLSVLRLRLARRAVLSLAFGLRWPEVVSPRWHKVALGKATGGNA